MDETIRSLGIKCSFQQEAVRLLKTGSPYRYMEFVEPEQFRISLIESLKQGDSAVRINKVNAAIDALVEQGLLIRWTKSKRHGIGLNKEIWNLSPDTIDLVQHATTSITKYMLNDSDLSHVVHDVKVLFRKFGYTRENISDAVFDILVTRFRAPVNQQKLTRKKKPIHSATGQNRL